jgi:hypothetical protein
MKNENWKRKQQEKWKLEQWKMQEQVETYFWSLVENIYKLHRLYEL